MPVKRILKALRTPSAWGQCMALARPFLVNLLRYRTISLNPNTENHWNKRLAEFGDTWRDENYRHILDLLPANEPFTLLDIGCALGDGCELLRSRFPLASITGTDISRLGIERARKRKSGVEYLVHDVLLQHIPKVYDYITIIETLEHFDNPFPVIEKCLRHVRKAMIISVPYNQRVGEERAPIQAQLANRSEHRFTFAEDTLSRFGATVVRITEFQEVTQDRCIIYRMDSSGSMRPRSGADRPCGEGHITKGKRHHSHL